MRCSTSRLWLIYYYYMHFFSSKRESTFSFVFIIRVTQVHILCLATPGPSLVPRSAPARRHFINIYKYVRRRVYIMYGRPAYQTLITRTTTAAQCRVDMCLGMIITIIIIIAYSGDHRAGLLISQHGRRPQIIIIL